MTELFPTSPLCVWECIKCHKKGECRDENMRVCDNPKCGAFVYPHAVLKGAPEDQPPYRKE